MNSYPTPLIIEPLPAVSTTGVNMSVPSPLEMMSGFNTPGFSHMGPPVSYPNYYGPGNQAQFQHPMFNNPGATMNMNNPMLYHSLTSNIPGQAQHGGFGGDCVVNNAPPTQVSIHSANTSNNNSMSSSPTPMFLVPQQAPRPPINRTYFQPPAPVAPAAFTEQISGRRMQGPPVHYPAQQHLPTHVAAHRHSLANSQAAVTSSAPVTNLTGAPMTRREPWDSALRQNTPAAAALLEAAAAQQAVADTNNVQETPVEQTCDEMRIDGHKIPYVKRTNAKREHSYMLSITAIERYLLINYPKDIPPEIRNRKLNSKVANDAERKLLATKIHIPPDDRCAITEYNSFMQYYEILKKFHKKLSSTKQGSKSPQNTSPTTTPQVTTSRANTTSRSRLTASVDLTSPPPEVMTYSHPEAEVSITPVMTAQTMPHPGASRLTNGGAANKENNNTRANVKQTGEKTTTLVNPAVNGNSNNGNKPTAAAVNNQAAANKPVVGWLQVNNALLPYVIRGQHKFVPKHVIEYICAKKFGKAGCVPATRVETTTFNAMVLQAKIKTEFTVKTALINFDVVSKSVAKLYVKELPLVNPSTAAKRLTPNATASEKRPSAAEANERLNDSTPVASTAAHGSNISMQFQTSNEPKEKEPRNVDRNINAAKTSAVPVQQNQQGSMADHISAKLGLNLSSAAGQNTSNVGQRSPDTREVQSLPAGQSKVVVKRGPGRPRKSVTTDATIPSASSLTVITAIAPKNRTQSSKTATSVQPVVLRGKEVRVLNRGQQQFVLLEGVVRLFFGHSDLIQLVEGLIVSQGKEQLSKCTDAEEKVFLKSYGLNNIRSLQSKKLVKLDVFENNIDFIESILYPKSDARAAPKATKRPSPAPTDFTFKRKAVASDTSDVICID